MKLLVESAIKFALRLQAGLLESLLALRPNLDFICIAHAHIQPISSYNRKYSKELLVLSQYLGNRL